MVLFLGIDTEIEWINDLASIPIIGHICLFILTFIPAVLLSFACHSLIPELHDDIGFTKAMLFLLPLCNLGLWVGKIKCFIFFVPTWIFFGVIAIVKGYLMYKGIDNGQ